MTRRSLLRRSLVPAFVGAVLVVGCGDDGDDGGTTTTPRPDTPVSTQPTGSPDGDDGDVFPTEEARAAAEALLGTPEDELADDVRVARRGDETFALTEDYVLGRFTVELDDDGTGTYRVTAVTVELPDGPETYTAR